MIFSLLSRVPRATWIFAFRLIAAVGSSAIFGLVATDYRSGGSLTAAIAAGFLFGTAFVGGTGYRIILAVWSRTPVAAPASWSGAAALSSIACIVALGFWPKSFAPASHPILAFALAINFAYLAVKASCMLAGCCHAEVRFLGGVIGLRQVEVLATFAILIASATLAVIDMSLGALVGLLGHTALRLYSRAKRGRAATGWPPLRQPGAELAPLQILTTIAAAAMFI
jgi:hypothetical protein